MARISTGDEWENGTGFLVTDDGSGFMLIQIRVDNFDYDAFRRVYLGGRKVSFAGGEYRMSSVKADMMPVRPIDTRIVREPPKWLPEWVARHWPRFLSQETKVPIFAPFVGLVEFRVPKSSLEGRIVADEIVQMIDSVEDRQGVTV